MIDRFHVRNFKALRDVNVSLGRVNLLIGPNDSGKTSFLDAIGAFGRSVDVPLAQAFAGAWTGSDLVSDRDPSKDVQLEGDIALEGGQTTYGFTCRFGREGRISRTEREWARTRGEELPFPGVGKQHTCVQKLSLTSFLGDSGTFPPTTSCARSIHGALHGVVVLRLDPRVLALPVAPDANRRFKIDPSGFGLALCLDDILGLDRERFARLEERMRRIFPTFRSLQLLPEPAFRAPPADDQDVPQISRADGKGIHFRFESSRTSVPAAQLSDGMLLVLAYLTVLHLPDPPRLLLVEEPENGIHPKRLDDVIGVFRDIVKEQSQTQVVMTTHSPYVVDLFQPDEVYACRMDAETGVAISRLSESAVVARELKHFGLGEIWSTSGEERLMVRETPPEPTGQ